MKSNVAVILFPGTNCELEALRACKRSRLNADLIRWNDHEANLSSYSAFILPGGFSYEDRGRSGVIASKDPILDKIRKEAAQGKPLIGICNGAQILVETGLIPGLSSGDLQMALAWNERMKKGKILGVGFYNDWIYMRNDAKKGRSPFNRFSNKIVMHVPVAHGEGRFTTKNPEVLKKLIQNDQTIFRYCDKNGKIIDEFPINPNGAMYSLAGVCNPEGNVVALMPHPERTIKGQPIFDSLADAISKKSITQIKKSPTKFKEKNKQETIKNLEEKPDFTILIKLKITDNEEKTIQATIQKLGFNETELERQVYLGFYLEKKQDLKKTVKKLINSGEILNLNKETPTIFIDKNAYTFTKESELTAKALETSNYGNYFLVREYDNYIGKSILSTIKTHFPEIAMKKVERGIIWKIKASQSSEYPAIINTHIFHNPNAMNLVAVKSF